MGDGAGVDDAVARAQVLGRTAVELDGEVALEVVASDAAGNVSRRSVALAIRAVPPSRGAPVAYASVGGATAFAIVLALSLVAGALLRRRRRTRPLRDLLIAGSVEPPPER